MSTGEEINKRKKAEVRNEKLQRLYCMAEIHEITHANISVDKRITKRKVMRTNISNLKKRGIEYDLSVPKKNIYGGLEWQAAQKNKRCLL